MAIDCEESFVCDQCLDDPHLQALIKDNALDHRCSFCGRLNGDEPIAAAFELVAQRVIEGISELYGQADDEGVPYESREGGYQLPVYESFEILDEIGLYVDNQELRRCLEDALPDQIWSERNPFSLRREQTLEIWDEFRSSSKVDGRVVPMRRAIQPIIDRIRVWKGFETYRNTALAHPYTTKSGELVPPWELTRSGQAPSFHAEQVLLLQLVVFAVAGILTVFENEFRPIEPLCGPTGPPPTAAPGISKGTEIEPTLRPILSHVDQQLKAECGVVAAGDLVAAFRKAIKPWSEARSRSLYGERDRSPVTSCNASLASPTLPCSPGSASSQKRKNRLYATAAESRCPSASYLRPCASRVSGR